MGPPVQHCSAHWFFVGSPLIFAFYARAVITCRFVGATLPAVTTYRTPAPDVAALRAAACAPRPLPVAAVVVGLVGFRSACLPVELVKTLWPVPLPTIPALLPATHACCLPPFVATLPENRRFACRVLFCGWLGCRLPRFYLYRAVAVTPPGLVCCRATADIPFVPTHCYTRYTAERSSSCCLLLCVWFRCSGGSGSAFCIICHPAFMPFSASTPWLPLLLLVCCACTLQRVITRRTSSSSAADSAVALCCGSAIPALVLTHICRYRFPPRLVCLPLRMITALMPSSHHAWFLPTCCDYRLPAVLPAPFTHARFGFPDARHRPRSSVIILVYRATCRCNTGWNTCATTAARTEHAGLPITCVCAFPVLGWMMCLLTYRVGFPVALLLNAVSRRVGSIHTTLLVTFELTAAAPGCVRTHHHRLPPVGYALLPHTCRGGVYCLPFCHVAAGFVSAHTTFYYAWTCQWRTFLNACSACHYLTWRS